jgi:flagellar biosynthetic protein FliP
MNCLGWTIQGINKTWRLFLISFFIFFGLTGVEIAQAQVNVPGMSINFGQGADLVDSLQVLILFTVLTLAPAIIIMCTSFTRIIVVLSFMRQAIGTQNLPPNQLLIGFALFLSAFVMMPTGKSIYENSVTPYLAKKINTTEAVEGIEKDLRVFMIKHVRKADIQLFYDVTSAPAPATVEDVPTYYLIPAFIISELKTAFQIGFLLYIPFLVLDMVVASVLMAMGMMMLPPVLVSMPFKLLLFVLVDGWQLVTGSILRSFN